MVLQIYAMSGFSAIASSGRFEPFICWRAPSEKNDALLKRRSPSLPSIALLGSDVLKRLPLPLQQNAIGRARLVFIIHIY
jgi:hypothetical protein